MFGLLYACVRPVLARGLVRYQFGMGVLLALAVCPLVTAWHLLNAIPSFAASSQAILLPMVVSSPVGNYGTPAEGFNALLPWLVFAWSLGVLLHSARAWRQWRALKGLVHASEPAPYWQQRASDLAKRVALHRRITVLSSRMVASPVLIGWFRPVILLPLAVVCGFPATQIELIQAHELAHLWRWDPLANLFQAVLETVHFYHPVVRWISRDVSNEREICCDQLALSLGGGSRREFVTALAELGELRQRHGGLVLAANGGVLLTRVQLMLVPQRQIAQTRKGVHVVASVLGAAMVILTLRLQWIQGHMDRGMDNAIGQLQTLILPVGLRPLLPGGDWYDQKLSQIQLGPVKLFSVNVEAPPERSLSPLGPVTLPRPARQFAPDLRLDEFEALVPASPAVVEPLASTVHSPTLIRSVQPIYPPSALERGIEGRVVVEFAVGKDGSVHDLRTIRSTPAGVFDQSALDAVQLWKYVVPSAAIATRYRQTVSFTLNSARASIGSAGARSMRDVPARSICQIVTGTHICRMPDDDMPAGRQSKGMNP